MSNRPLNNQDNFNSISEWLNSNLQQPIIANSSKLPADDGNRGIYFWFMKPAGYEKLSEMGLTINAINPSYSKEIQGDKYHLVYIGTAGTNRNENNTLILRLEWHLNNIHSANNICHGTLSTLRQTVGSALSDDLIIPNTEADVNQFFNDFFYVYTIPYLGNANNAEQINNDEFYLISVLKPLFNIKNNPNALIAAAPNPTRLLKERRGEILRNTRARLGCNQQNRNEANYPNNDSMPPDAPVYNHEIAFIKDSCIEFTVTQDQSIHQVINGIASLPTGNCFVKLFDSRNLNEFVYVRANGETSRRTRIIYQYFGNPDTNLNNMPRWQIIQQEMRDRNIEEITVRVCETRN